LKVTSWVRGRKLRRICGVVDMADLEIMAGDWLAADPTLGADLNADSTVDFKDYAALADRWLDEQLWPEW